MTVPRPPDKTTKQLADEAKQAIRDVGTHHQSALALAKLHYFVIGLSTGAGLMILLVAIAGALR